MTGASIPCHDHLFGATCSRMSVRPARPLSPPCRLLVYVACAAQPAPWQRRLAQTGSSLLCPTLLFSRLPLFTANEAKVMPSAALPSLVPVPWQPVLPLLLVAALFEDAARHRKWLLHAHVAER